MVCPSCHTPNFHDYKYCRECGTRLDPLRAGDAGLGDATMTDGATLLPATLGSKDNRVDQVLKGAIEALQQGDEGRAKALAQSALALDPHSAAAHSVLGLVYEQQGMLNEAIHQVEMALQLSPDSTADRLKLEALRAAAAGRNRRSRRLSPAMVMAMSGAASGALVFGCGLALLLSSAPPARTGSSDSQAATTGRLQPTTSAVAPRTSAPAPAPVSTVLPTPPRSRLQVLPAPVSPTPKPLAAPGFGSAPHFGSGRFPAPVARAGNLPSFGSSRPPLPGAPAPASGLAPAEVRQVVPIQANPAAAGTPVLPGAPQLVGGAPGVPGPGVAPAGGPVAPRPEALRPAPPAVEPNEPETGFIKVEPAGTRPPR